MSRRPLPSLRLWLQSSTLIAVLAGYGVLLGVSAGLTVVERRAVHQQMVAELAASLTSRALTPQDLQTGIAKNVSLSLAPPSPVQAVQPVQHNGQTWLESRTPLNRPGQKPVVLVVRQNITGSIQRERTLQLLLVAAAGLASLFTSALLRPVLRRGLVDPIEALCAQLQQVSSPSTVAIPMAETEQPSELQPIAAAFNAMQQRLATAWEQERTFTDGAAHELRTPITLIMGQAQSLLRQPLPEPQQRAVQAISKEAAHMAHLVSDLLNLARQDAGRLQLRCQPLDPEAVLLEAFDHLRPLAPTRLQLAPASAEPLPPVQGDPERLVQCLTALVDNALSYAPTGPVELAVSCTADGVIWHVQDKGPGVAADERELIFERFARGSAAITTAESAQRRGSGLGLALVRLLMEAMGGSVIAANRPGGGADFQLQLPMT